MKSCNDYCTNIYWYLDEEEGDAASEEFWAHCESVFCAERPFTLRRAVPTPEECISR